MGAQVESLRVMVIDDEIMFLDLYRAGLRKSGHQVEFFSEAEAALSHWGNNPVDVIILDRNMPERSGLEVARAIRESGSDIPIGMASSGVIDLSPSQKTEILQQGVDLLVEKSDALDDVVGFISKLHHLGQARQNSRQSPQKAMYVLK